MKTDTAEIGTQWEIQVMEGGREEVSKKMSGEFPFTVGTAAFPGL